MFRKGKHTKRELIRRLRSENRHYERQMPLLRARLRKVGEELRTESSKREIADGLVQKQDLQIRAKDAEIERLQRELADRTVEIPIPAAA
ncbi:hypothetical protein ACN2WE_05445 [Streptomyces sp. cg28]|uniref:hypothetical protein n=1 Tax=Streptomyces sp. cg28 TaxID=3403457 RepID=UPI003B20F7D7